MLSPVRIGITGSRYFYPDDDGPFIDCVLDEIHYELRRRIKLPELPLVIVHGGASGADALAGLWAKKHGHEVEVHKADWRVLGKGSGPKRNQIMVDRGATIWLAFPGRGSQGTWDCVRRAAAAGIETRIYSRGWK